MNAPYETPEHDQKGFSMVEALVVVALVSAALIAFSIFSPISRGGAKLNAFTMELAAILRSTRTQAISDNREQSFIFDLPNRRYYMGNHSVERPIPREFDLKVTSARLRAEAEGQSIIKFFGDGSSTGGEIRVNSENRRNTIEIGWLTGSIAVREGR